MSRRSDYPLSLQYLNRQDTTDQQAATQPAVSSIGVFLFAFIAAATYVLAAGIATMISTVTGTTMLIAYGFYASAGTCLTGGAVLALLSR